MFKQLKGLFGRGGNQGFTLIELLIVILIIGILAAVAAPLYLGYVRDARTAEGKSVVGALWTSVQANGVASCNSNVDVSSAFLRAGLNSSGETADGRWKTTDGGNTINIDCTTGVITPGSSDVFTLSGQKSDNTGISVKLVYDTALSPASQLFCDTAGGTPNSPC